MFFKFLISLVLVFLAWQPINVMAQNPHFQNKQANVVKPSKKPLVYKKNKKKKTKRNSWGTDFGKCSRTLTVQSTAYVSLPQYTDPTPWIASNSYIMRRGEKLLAVSQDLMRCIPHGHKVTVTGTRNGVYDGEYKVVDAMNERWSKKADFWFETDLRGARQFGRQYNITISY